MDYDIERVRRVLLDRLQIELGPEQGWEAFERHQLLAIRLHRAARLNAPGEGERAGWCRYFDEYFPRGGEHGRLLFERWRSTLLKDEFPAAGVAITHGQPEAHWQLTPLGLVVNLETMWDDFTVSVNRFVDALAKDEAAKASAVAVLNRTQWVVKPVTIERHTPTILSPNRSIMLAPSVTASATVIALPHKLTLGDVDEQQT